jgi:hypothetical protein
MAYTRARTAASSVAVALVALLFLCDSAPARTGAELELRVASSQADTVSGGNVLIRLGAPLNSTWSAQLNNRDDVTRSFRHAEGSDEFLALLTGLRDGVNTLRIWVDGTVRAAVEIVNHPIAGPVFSGPQQEPFVCQTDSNGLGAASDANCGAKTIVQYYYKSTSPVLVDGVEMLIRALRLYQGRDLVRIPSGFAPYDLDHPPKDVAQTVLVSGRTVPYIVRREVGVINRAIFDIRFLHRPGNPLPTPWTVRTIVSTGSWNGRLVYEFGGGCAAGYRQGTLLGTTSKEVLLARGYAVATSTLNIFGNDCNDIRSAETLSMVKEYFIKRYGEPVHTIGWGDSGGAIQQYLIAQNYPGLLDGIIPNASFPDIATWLSTTTDCPLLLHAFETTGQVWSDSQKSAVTGYATWRVCSTVAGLFVQAAHNCNSVVPKKLVYDPKRRRRAARCDIYDNNVNVLGRDPATGFASRPLDNVGVQYGLAAFNNERIDSEQFLALNEHVGGYDADGDIVATRTRAPPEAIRNAYEHGWVQEGGGGLSSVPIIDWRSYVDDLGNGHDSLRSFVTRARLIATNGSADNQVIQIYPRADTLANIAGEWIDTDPRTSVFARRKRDLVEAMDHWIDNIAADRSGGTQLERVARTRPKELEDACWSMDGEKITGPDIYGPGGRCTRLYPRYASPRIVAGGPVTDDVLKCQLKPVSMTEYSHPLMADQIARLKAIFPTGVCDYTRPGANQEAIKTTWQRFDTSTDLPTRIRGKNAFKADSP